MSYFRELRYEIALNGSFLALHGCSGCGRHTHFKNTEKFRVNANGNKLDIWLIYQCVECKHTLNLAIYERKKVSSIPEKEYKGFLGNDRQLAEMYGKNMQLFKKNKVKIDFGMINYSFRRLDGAAEEGSSFAGQAEWDIQGYPEETILKIQNPYQLKIRPEKQISEVLGLSRNQAKKCCSKGNLGWKLFHRNLFAPL